MKGTAESISSILKRVIKKDHLYKMKEAGIKMDWKQIVGEELAKHTAPGFLKNGKLFVNVDSATWAYELSTHLKGILMNKINADAGEQIVKDIHFKVGDFAGNGKR